MAKKQSRMTVSQRADGFTIRATGAFAIKLLERLAGEASALPQEIEKSDSSHIHQGVDAPATKEQ